jgi:ABC-type molybdate transport system ATPase subunit
MLEADIQLRLGQFSLDTAFTVAPGEVLALLGPNGSGKSTTLQALTGLLPLAGGRIVLDGTVLDDPAQRTRVAPEQRPIALMFQNYLLFPHLSALENVAFGLRARGTDKKTARQKASEALARVGLDGGGQLICADSVTGPVFAVIAPAAVSVHRQQPDATAQNLWRGSVGDIDLMGDRVRVRVDGTPAITAEVPPSAVDELKLDEGGELWASVSPAAVTVYPP